MNQKMLDYAAVGTPHRSPKLHWLLGAIDVLFGCVVVLVVLAALIGGSCLILMNWWIAAIATLALIPAAIIGGIRVSDLIATVRGSLRR
jgi:hypothetical protein